MNRNWKKPHVINFRLTDDERANLDALVAWANHEDQRTLREEQFHRHWGHVSISDVIRWQLGRAHDVIQAEISARKTKAPQLGTKRKTLGSKRKTTSRAHGN